MSDKRFAITFVFDDSKSRILLGWKKRKYGENKYYGYGGKIELGETIRQAASRELREESFLQPIDPYVLKPKAVLKFDNAHQTVHAGTMYIFKTNFEALRENLMESEEMRPSWFRWDSIPYEDMWPDSKIWMPFLLDDKFFCAEFTYSAAGTLIRCNVVEKDKAPFDPDI